MPTALYVRLIQSAARVARSGSATVCCNWDDNLLFASWPLWPGQPHWQAEGAWSEQSTASTPCGTAAYQLYSR
jgi:hypothetical protein